MKKFLADNNLSWTEAMSQYTDDLLEEKFSKLDIDLNATTIKVSQVNKILFKVTASIESYRAQATDADFYQAVRKTLTKLKTIILKDVRKHKTKYRNKRTVSVSNIEDIYESLISKEKEFNLFSITVTDAIDCFEKTDYGFYVFRDTDEHDVISILYHRPDGTYGIIRCK